MAQESLSITETERVRAEALRETCGLRSLDALHLACAETLQADVFLTTDDRLLRAIHRTSADALSVIASNPLTWLTEQLTQE